MVSGASCLPGPLRVDFFLRVRPWSTLGYSLSGCCTRVTCFDSAS